MLPSLISNFKAWLPWQNVGQISTVNKHCETASLNCYQAAFCKQNAFVSAAANTSLLWLQTAELKMLWCWLCENMLWRYCWKKARCWLILIKKNLKYWKCHIPLVYTYKRNHLQNSGYMDRYGQNRTCLYVLCNTFSLPNQTERNIKKLLPIKPLYPSPNLDFLTLHSTKRGRLYKWWVTRATDQVAVFDVLGVQMGLHFNDMVTVQWMHTCSRSVTLFWPYPWLYLLISRVKGESKRHCVLVWWQKCLYLFRMATLKACCHRQGKDLMLCTNGIAACTFRQSLLEGICSVAPIQTQTEVVVCRMIKKLERKV